MKRIYRWSSSRSRRYKECPYNFDFVKGCQTGLVVWWNYSFFCLDLSKLEVNKILGEK